MMEIYLTHSFVLVVFVAPSKGASMDPAVNVVTILDIEWRTVMCEEDGI
jgi:hypothetical protein